MAGTEKPPGHTPEEHAAYARHFSEEALFHKPDAAFARLGLQDVPKGARLLDIGCGKGELVALLRARGIDAVGVDLAGEEAGVDQRPDHVASADALPFEDDEFDMAVSHWGGLAYPLYEMDIRDKPEEVREALVAHLDQLKESLRVAKELRMTPWSLQPFFELTGTLVLTSENIHSTDLQFVRVDFHKLFHDMGLSVDLRGTDLSPADPSQQALSLDTLTLDKSSTYDDAPLESLIADIRTVEGLTVSRKELAAQPEYEELAQAMKELMMAQGTVNAVLRIGKSLTDLDLEKEKDVAVLRHRMYDADPLPPEAVEEAHALVEDTTLSWSEKRERFLDLYEGTTIMVAAALEKARERFKVAWQAHPIEMINGER
jgi:SAM-dependent methyltransferase